ncbi:MAG TPA: HPr family phosphocarrier protein [Thermoleophilia bacterium]|jgi:phosphotransferase system HPr (HPr) family protein|nr:HPr family phosphocarrier protein [Thermoleophilia bacterium]
MYPNSDAALPNTALGNTAFGNFDNAGFDNAGFDNTVFEMAVTLPANLHARPAGKLAQAAARFSSGIRIDYGAKSVNPTGVLAVMSLGATVGTVVTLHAEGPDAEEAVQTLARILREAE